MRTQTEKKPIDKTHLIKGSADENPPTALEQIHLDFSSELSNLRESIARLEIKVDKLLGPILTDEASPEDTETDSSIIGLLNDDINYYRSLNIRFIKTLERLEKGI